MSSTSSVMVSMAIVGSATAAQFLAPANSINLPASESSSEPLQWLGGNSPYFAGSNIPSLE